MRIDGRARRSIAPGADGRTVVTIDQTRLPHEARDVTLATLAEAADAISTMIVRGAPLIGVTGAYGLALALREDSSDAGLEAARGRLAATRPTAVNLRWALDRVHALVAAMPSALRAEAAFVEAGRIADEDVALCSAIGDHGLSLIEAAYAANGRARPVNVLTHCNAGWLATVDWGTATAPIYKAAKAGVPVHVWVDETRPRNQGAGLTAFELGQESVPHTVIADNAGGHLMQMGQVDLCIVGTDRTTATGDVANKIGTYLKALAARDTGVPFYVALPSSTIDWRITDGLRDIPIEHRSAREVTHVAGLTEEGVVETVQVTPEGTGALNPAFDVTPARLVTGLITERGIAPASREGLRALFPEFAATVSAA